ncbi:mitochondrial fission ELM1 family protein, partial [Gammaproteobacteria bacterium]|nr:mitochondrial fission ELM1 family protein [Gammaproteobacteria bacterium]
SIGGKNKHYEFNEDYILEQIRFLSSIYPYKIWYIFNSRRTPDSMNNKIYNLIKDFKNLNFEDINNSESKNVYKDILKSSSIRVITRDSVSMVYESLSSSGKSFLFDMDAKQSNKIVKNISMLINERRIGSLDKNLMADGLYKLQLRPQNKHLDVLREVEKLAYTILKRLKKL